MRTTFQSFAFASWARTIFVVIALLGSLSARAAADEKNYTGHYELLAAKANRSFSLDVKQDGSRATISFNAAMADGSGAAPDATGKGHVEDGVLNFKFTDSFKNEGTAVLTRKQNVYQLSLTVTKVDDPSPLHFYGAMVLKQTSPKPDN
jgi:hypothetical protein